MKPAQVILCLLPALIMTAAQAQDTVTYAFLPMFGQQLVIRQPAQWQMVSSFRNEHQEIVQFLPEGEDAEDWAERISIHAYAGIAAHTTYGPDVILRTLGQTLREHCRTEVLTQTLEHLNINGYPAVTRLIGCAQLKETSAEATGLGEMGFYLAIKGKQDFYVLGHVLRGSVFSPELAPMNRDNFMAYAEKTSPVMLCAPGNTLEACLHPHPLTVSSPEPEQKQQLP